MSAARGHADTHSDVVVWEGTRDDDRSNSYGSEEVSVLVLGIDPLPGIASCEPFHFYHSDKEGRGLTPSRWTCRLSMRAWRRHPRCGTRDCRHIRLRKGLQREIMAHAPASSMISTGLARDSFLGRGMAIAIEQVLTRRIMLVGCFGAYELWALALGAGRA